MIRQRWKSWARWALAAIVVLGMVGCKSDAKVELSGGSQPSNSAPVIANQSFSTPQDTDLSDQLNANDADGDALSFNLDSTPSNGGVVLNSDGSFTYTPDNGFVGDDTFTVTVSDGTDTSNLATITITVEAVATDNARAVLGPVAGATIQLFELPDRETPLQTATTSSGENLVDIGFFGLATDTILTDGLYLIEVTGGQDFDADDDGIMDGPTDVQGTLHAIVDGAEIQAASSGAPLLVNVMTEVGYQLVQWRLAAGDPVADVRADLDRIAENLLSADLSGDGTINRRDLTAFDPGNANHKAALATSGGFDSGLNPSLKPVIDRVHAGRPRLNAARAAAERLLSGAAIGGDNERDACTVTLDDGEEFVVVTNSSRARAVTFPSRHEARAGENMINGNFVGCVTGPPVGFVENGSSRTLRPVYLAEIDTEQVVAVDFADPDNPEELDRTDAGAIGNLGSRSLALDPTNTDRLYAADLDSGNIIAVDIDDPTNIGIFTEPDSSQTSFGTARGPQLHAEADYLVSAERNGDDFRLIDTADGSTLRDIRLPGFNMGGMTIVDDVLYVTALDDPLALWAFDLRAALDGEDIDYRHAIASLGQNDCESATDVVTDGTRLYVAIRQGGCANARDTNAYVLDVSDARSPHLLGRLYADAEGPSSATTDGDGMALAGDRLWVTDQVLDTRRIGTGISGGNLGVNEAPVALPTPNGRIAQFGFLGLLRFLDNRGIDNPTPVTPRYSFGSFRETRASLVHRGTPDVLYMTLGARPSQNGRESRLVAINLDTLDAALDTGTEPARDDIARFIDVFPGISQPLIDAMLPLPNGPLLLGNYGDSADSDFGLVDISVPDDPVFTGTLPTPGDGGAAALLPIGGTDNAGVIAAITGSERGIYVFDIDATAGSIDTIGHVPWPADCDPYALLHRPPLLYVASQFGGCGEDLGRLDVIDLSDRSAPLRLHHQPLEGEGRALAFSGGVLYALTARPSVLAAFDLSAETGDALAPRRIGTLMMPNYGDWLGTNSSFGGSDGRARMDLEVRDEHLLVGGGNSGYLRVPLLPATESGE